MVLLMLAHRHHTCVTSTPHFCKLTRHQLGVFNPVSTSKMNLTSLADQFGSDKGTKTREGHRYAWLYDLLFHDLRDKPIRFLEMGLAIGGPEVNGPVDRHVN